MNLFKKNGFYPVCSIRFNTNKKERTLIKNYIAYNGKINAWINPKRSYYEY